ncbi:hypothetical protein AAF712_008858 [Marasmius tenuissimus]|uniref:Uncharacterized protein n=1 Tax=Marasmius tenuissimus TaxID=585030 RepID=A0ABR2ZRC5_9AGAR
MGALSYLAKDLQASPPSAIDLDRIGFRTKRALEALSRIAQSLERSPNPTTVDGVAGSWNRIWPWMHSIARAVLDEACKPATAEGEEFIQEYLRVTPTLFCYPIFQDGCSDHGLIADSLKSFVHSNPRLFPIAVQLWLFSSHNNRSSASALGNAVGALAVHATKGPELEHILLDTRWDAIRASIRLMVGTAIPCAMLQRGLSVFQYVVGILSDLLTGATLLSKLTFNRAVPSLVLVISRLTSGKRIGSSCGHSDLGVCAIECIAFLETTLAYDTFFAIEALDSGVLPAVLAIRKVLEPQPSGPPFTQLGEKVVKAFASFLDSFLPKLVYRPILVRVVRWIKKIRDSGKITSKEAFAACPEVYQSWIKLEYEATRRYGYSKTILQSEPDAVRSVSAEPRKTVPSIVVLDVNQSSIVPNSVKRPIGRRATAKSASGPRARYEIVLDFGSNRRLIRRLTHEYAARHSQPDNDDGVIAWIDYESFPPTIEVDSISSSRRRVKAFVRDSTVGDPTKGGINRMVVAIGRIPMAVMERGKMDIVLYHFGEDSHEDKY